MPKFVVHKGHDAYIRFRAIVEADSAEAANELMAWKATARELDWKSDGVSDPFDHYDPFPDETEQLTDEEAEEIAAEDAIEWQELRVTIEERDVILAALRHFQAHLPSVSDEILDVATDGGSHAGLDENAIDELCERINT